MARAKREARIGKNPTTADGYIRVSRRGGREGESSIAPDVQRKKIEGWAELHGVEIVRWWEEIDQSGARLERPMFQEALERCEAGETGGIVVARLDRFARSAVDALTSIKRLNAAGARLVSVEDNFDGSTPMGRFAIGILTLIAELELERIKESWRIANVEAVGRGVHVSARVPVGYTRDENGRLHRDGPAASAVAEVFRKRAVGASYTELAEYLDGEGVKPSTGNPHWSRQGVSGLLKNPVYLGEARSGTITNPDAHEAIVTRAEFDAAHLAHTVHATRDGSLSEQALLTGIVRCAGCGHTLKVSGSTDRKTGQRLPTYYCSKRFATGICPAPAGARASTLDPYVEEQVLALLTAEGGLIAEARVAAEQLEERQRDVEAAEHELDLFVNNPRLLTILGEAKFVEGVESRQHAVDQARAQLAKLRTQTSVISDLPEGDVLKAWPDLTVIEKRYLLHSLLDQVELTNAGGKRGRAAPPIGTRTRIVLRGAMELGPASATTGKEETTPAEHRTASGMR